MAFRDKDLPVILALLKEMATVREVQELLRQHGVPVSAPRKDSVLSDRLEPAIREKQISIDQVASLLAEVEEHGHQHVLLYRFPKDAFAGLVEPKKVRIGLAAIGAPDILDSPRVLDKPTTPTFTEARVNLNKKGNPHAFVIKQTMTKTSRGKAKEKLSPRGDFLLIRIPLHRERVINVVKLHADGLIEIRIQSHRTPDYSREAQKLLIQLQPLLPPPSSLSRYVLTNAKQHLVKNRRDLEKKGEVKFSVSTLRNHHGRVLTAATGNDKDSLFDDTGTDEGIGVFLSNGGYCDDTAIKLRSGDTRDRKPNWVNSLVSGADNEFALTSQVTMREYDHVLAQLRFYNR